jgi:hypothetical protein
VSDIAYRLLAPLLGGVFFVAALSVLIAVQVGMNRYIARGMLACGALMSFAGYILVFSDRIQEAWSTSPFEVIVGGAVASIIPISLFLWIWHVQQEWNLFQREQRNNEMMAAPREVSLPMRLLRFALFVWGAVNVVGIFAMIIKMTFFQH